MILKFWPVRKYGRTVGLSENKPITSSSPRNGPSTLKMRREAVGFFDRVMPVSALSAASNNSDFHRGKGRKRRNGATVEHLALFPSFSSLPSVSLLHCGLFQIFIQRRIKQVLNFVLLHILLPDQHNTRITPLLDPLSAQVLYRSRHAEITH